MPDPNDPALKGQPGTQGAQGAQAGQGAQGAQGAQGTQGPEPKPGDPLTTKLEGDGVPEKFKGKTIKEVLALSGTTEAELTKAKTELTQWLQYAQDLERTEKEKSKPAYDPMEHLDEETARAVSVLMGEQLRPLTSAMEGFMMDRVTATRPDFDEHKERAMKIFKDLPFEYKFHPAYGMDFAYRFAKAEKEGGPPPLGPAPPHMGPSATGPDPDAGKPALTKAELYVADRMGMAPEEYTKYKAEQSPTEVSEKKKE